MYYSACACLAKKKRLEKEAMEQGDDETHPPLSYPYYFPGPAPDPRCNKSSITRNFIQKWNTTNVQ